MKGLLVCPPRSQTRRIRIMSSRTPLNHYRAMLTCSLVMIHFLQRRGTWQVLFTIKQRSLSLRKQLATRSNPKRMVRWGLRNLSRESPAHQKCNFSFWSLACTWCLSQVHHHCLLELQTRWRYDSMFKQSAQQSYGLHWQHLENLPQKSPAALST